MKPMDPELAEMLRGDPDSLVEVVLTAAQDLDDLLAALGTQVEVTHVYRLIRGVAVRTSRAMVRRLAAHQAVASIEPVRGVKHC